MLKWCYENISEPDKSKTNKEVLSAIGGVYLEELYHMGFVAQWYDWVSNCHCVFLTDFGKKYCEEIFN
jgi:hypothetical protein